LNKRVTPAARFVRAIASDSLKLGAMMIKLFLLPALAKTNWLVGI